MTAQELLSSWSFDPVPTAAVLVAGLLYAGAWARAARQSRGRRPMPLHRPVCFGLGLLAIVVAVNGPPDYFEDSSFSMHMLQHMLLQMVAAPLLLLGGPIFLVLRADPWWFRRRALVRTLRSRSVAVLTHPVTALALFAVALFGTHLTALYEVALEHEWVHQLEHVGYLSTALLFWWPALGVDPAPHRMSHAMRLFYLMVAMPIPAFLGLAIANAGHPIYASYSEPTPWGASALADQQAAGTLMWVAGMLTTAPAIAVVLMRWLDEESRRGPRHEAIAASRSSPHGWARGT